jgi:hypothetical protein
VANVPMPPSRPAARAPQFSGFVGMTPPRPGPTGPTRAIPRPLIPEIVLPPTPRKRDVRPRGRR